MLAEASGPYSTYLRGDPHDEGYIMAALPPTVANGRVYAATFSGQIMVYGLK